MRRDHRPLRIRQISLVAQAFAAMMRPGGRGPHDISSSVSTTCWNHSNPRHSISFETASKATGRPSYHPSILLRLYIYGYLNRVQSSRRLEREAGRNVEVMWLLGRLAPD